ncbi:uncharacterized protein LOC131927899 [Physella acuta]|uniref:uncharacterized protein LOC131927899 n=1 Tax=Physella acuta TaxID=109671 RepID=UPI0027DB8C10|nr:uncharacterized protein LOC131927899 [Physella acuta]
MDVKITKLTLSLLQACISHIVFCVIYVSAQSSTARIEAEEMQFSTRRMSRPNAPFVADWVNHMGDDHVRRSTYNITDKNWPHDIPYVIESSYTGDRVSLRLVMDYISSRVCVMFHDVAATYNKSDSHWLTNHGFKTNSYVSIRDGNGCSASQGQDKYPGAQPVYPCNGFGINLHEMLHVLGVIHTHQGRIRDSYMSINEADIKPELAYSYRKITVNSLVNNIFDPTSTMMYSSDTWSLDGLETYTPIRDDFFHTSLEFSEEHVVFLELNSIYRCNELFCNNDQTDCGPGYHTLINGRCRCVCPDELDYNTNCRTHIDGPAKDISWPDTQIIIYGNTSCPSGFEPTPAMLPLSGNLGAYQEDTPERYHVTNKTLYLPLCKKSSPANPGDVNWKTWPLGGQFCFVRPLGQPCGGVFEEGGIEFQTLNETHPSGDIGNISISGRMVTINYCCKNKEHHGLVMDLPNAEPFKLIAKSMHCPKVRGMKSTNSRLTFWTNSSRNFGPLPPLSYFYPNSFLHYQCYLQPPIYGCSHLFTLTPTNRSVTVTTPGFETQREPNRRCFYSFNVPPQSKLRLTLNKFDLHDNDEFMIKRFHQWQDPYRIVGEVKPDLLVSEGDYLSLQYWASWEKTNKKGINFTVDIVLAEEMCYDVATKGADYYGEKSVTETFEPCVPWEKATSCDDFPFDGLNGISLLESGSSCRNPGGSLLQPWCYTFVRGSVCHRRYCDVCNIQKSSDVLKTCSTLKTTVPDFCNTAVERFACFQTCGLSQQTYTPATCSPPSLPSDVYAAGGLKSVYKEGEVINVTCTTSGSFVNTIRCTKTGWSGQAFTCNGCPEHWSVYEDRCFRYFTAWVTRRQAELVCKSHDVTGTLFEVRTLADQVMVRQFKQNGTSEYHQGNWISGQLQSDDGKWLFDSGNVMSYFNWSSTAETTNMSYNCIKLIAEYQGFHEQGGWRTMACNSTEPAPYMCQVDNSLSRACNDKVPTCKKVLETYPAFCTDSRTARSRDVYCRKTCGHCPGGSQCSDPMGTTYTRTSQSAVISPGQVMNFTCQDHLYHVGGDLQRACSTSGTLLGSEPVCLATPKAMDLKLETIRARSGTLAPNIAILLDKDGYRIPFNGKVTRWYYYCKSSGIVNFIVFRRSGSVYTFVGSNTVNCEPEWIRTYNVPLANQIDVFQNDVYGVYTPNKTTLSISDCDTAYLKVMTLPATNVTSLADLRSSSGVLFQGNKCAVPSLGLRVEP